jgi:hypothetical protein
MNRNAFIALTDVDNGNPVHLRADGIIAITTNHSYEMAKHTYIHTPGPLAYTVKETPEVVLAMISNALKAVQA